MFVTEDEVQRVTDEVHGHMKEHVETATRRGVELIVRSVLPQIKKYEKVLTFLGRR